MRSNPLALCATAVAHLLGLASRGELSAAAGGDVAYEPGDTAGAQPQRRFGWNGSNWSDGSGRGMGADAYHTVIVPAGESWIVEGDTSAAPDNRTELLARFVVSGRGTALDVTHAQWKAPVAPSAEWDGSGGCALVVHAATLRVAAVTVNQQNDNRVPAFGGAIAGSGGSRISVADSAFQGLRSGEGGAIFVNESSTLDVTGAVFTSCEATVAGGAIYAEGWSSVTIRNSEFSDCVGPENTESGDVLWLADVKSINITNSSVIPAEGRKTSYAVNRNQEFLDMVENGNCHKEASHCGTGYDCSVNQSFSLVCTPCGLNEHANGWTARGCTRCPADKIVTADRGGCEKPKIRNSQIVFTWCAYIHSSVALAA